MELNLHSEASRPQLTRELGEARRLRRHLGRVRREIHLSRCALEAQERDEECRQERIEEAEEFCDQLEAKADKLFRRSPMAQRHLRVETEAQEMRMERDELTARTRALGEGQRRQHRRVEEMSVAVLGRAAQLGVTAPAGLGVLYDLGAAVEVAAQLRGRIRCLGEEAAEAAADNRRLATDLGAALKTEQEQALVAMSAPSHCAV